MDRTAVEAIELSYVETLRDRTQTSITVRQDMLDGDIMEDAARVAACIVKAFTNDNRVIFFGNGGSSTDAAHLAAECLGRFYIDRKALPSMSLADNTAAMTAIANDYSYDDVFSRQIEGLGRPGDVAVGLTTSGNSVNVVKALVKAKEIGMIGVAFTGGAGGTAADVADISLRVPSTETPRIQECHMLLGHTICEIVEDRLFNKRG